MCHEHRYDLTETWARKDNGDRFVDPRERVSDFNFIRIGIIELNEYNNKWKQIIQSNIYIYLKKKKTNTLCVKNAN